MKSSKRAIGLLAVLGIVLTLGLCTYMVMSTGRPRPGSVDYEEYTRAFQVGLAALDSDLILQAEENLTRCTRMLPHEPSAWANLGLLYLRSGQLDQSNECLTRASELSPNSTAIAKLIAHLRQRQGQFDQAATILKKVIEAEPSDVRSLYQLIQVIDQQSQSDAEKVQFELLDRLLKVEPRNTRLLVDRLRAALRDRRTDEVRSTVEKLDQLSSAWQDRTVKALEDLKRALQQDPMNANQPSLLRFTNTLLAEASFVRDSTRLEAQDAFVGQPLENYLWLSPLRREPAIADMNLAFQRQELALKSDRPAKFLATFWSTTNAKVSIVEVGDASIRLGDIELVDTIDDAVGSAYSGIPNRLYLIDRQGKIAFKNARGPFGFAPRQLEQSLVLLLNEKSER